MQICLSTLGRKYIMALSGLLLGGFLLFHAAGNSLIFKGIDAFSAYAEHLRSLGLLMPAAGLLLLAVLLAHVITGISLLLRNRRAKGGSYAICRSAGGRQIWASCVMPCTGAVNFAFLLLHLTTIRFADQAAPVAERVSRTLTDPLLASLYTTGIVALMLHINHGFRSLPQSLGISHPAWNRAVQVCAWLAASLIFSTFIGIISFFAIFF